MATLVSLLIFFFFFNDTATTEIYTLSLHDALPIWDIAAAFNIDKNDLLINIPHTYEGKISAYYGYIGADSDLGDILDGMALGYLPANTSRSEEHTSELQSRSDLVCRLLLEKKRRRFLNEWEAFKKVISRRNIRRRITIPLTLSNLKLLRRITRTENILHRNFTRRQVAIQNRVASNIGISQSTFSVKVLNLFSLFFFKNTAPTRIHTLPLSNPVPI